MFSEAKLKESLSFKGNKGKKVKVKQPYFTSITRDSNSTDKLKVDGALILLPSLHQCSVLRVFKASQNYTENTTQNGMDQSFSGQ